MSFRFRLEKVLRHRRHLADQQALLVKQAASALATIRQRQAAVQEVMASTLTAGVAERARSDVQLWRRRADYLAGQRHVLERLDEREQEALAELHRSRRELMEAHRRCRVLELLRERAHLAWQEEQRRRERKLMDEVAGQRAAAHGGAGQQRLP
jgi:flagellar export protein FliJ